MKVLNSCCCCVNLELGGKIIAILGIVGSIYQLVQIPFSTNSGYGASEYQSSGSEKAAAFTSNLFGLCISACLLYGILKAKHRFILAWLVISVIQAVFGVGIFIYLLTTVEGENSQAVVTIASIAIILAYALGIYLWFVIYSLYVKTKEQSIQQPYQPREYNGNYANCPPKEGQYPTNPNAAHPINSNVV